MLGNFSCFLSSADFFKLIFSTFSFSATIRVSHGLDQDQDRRSVGPELGSNRYAASMERVKETSIDSLVAKCTTILFKSK